MTTSLWCSLLLHHSVQGTCHSSCLPMSPKWPLPSRKHFINKDRHFKFTRILSKRYLLPLSFVVLWYSLHQQVHGTAVGSPVSVVVADLVMENVEYQALAFSPSLRIRKWYVETCCALQTDLIQDFHYHLHSIETSNQFTLETESAAQLNMEPWEINWHNRLQKTNTHKQVPRLQYGGNLDRSMHLTEDMHLQQMHLTTSRYSMSLHTLHCLLQLATYRSHHCTSNLRTCAEKWKSMFNPCSAQRGLSLTCQQLPDLRPIKDSRLYLLPTTNLPTQAGP